MNLSHSKCYISGSRAQCLFLSNTWLPLLPPGLTYLYVSVRHLPEINSTYLSGLTQLEELYLDRIHRSMVIRNDAFVAQSRLKKLVLSGNRDLQLEPRAFVGLSSLQELDLSHCSLNESILQEEYLQPLTSLETLHLSGNHIRRLQPAKFFANMSSFKYLDLRLNRIVQLCESDLAAFRGKHFNTLNLESGLRPSGLSNRSLDWKTCGNPFREMSFQSIDLSNNGLSMSQIKHFLRAIEGTKISHLKLSGHVGKGFSFNNLPDPDNSTFEGLKNSTLQILDLSKNRIFALRHGVFNPLREAKLIDISQNRVNEIHRNAFEGLQDQLKTLNLSHNLLGEIYSYTFHSLTNLEVLDLSHNNIGVLGYKAFSGLPKLKTLLFTGNALRDLGFPASLPSLHDLRLNDNRLTHRFMSNVAQFAANVTYLDISDNRVTDLESVYSLVSQLHHLQHFNFGGNAINLCSRHSSVGPNRLQVLDLHGNSLQSIWSQHRCQAVFDDMKHVKTLSLRDNKLEFVPWNIFKGMTSVVAIDLSSNLLTYLIPGVFPKHLKTLDLSNNFIASPDPAAFQTLSFLELNMNRFLCDSNLKSFLTWLNQTHVHLMSIHDVLKCAFPPSFRDVPVLSYAAQAKLLEENVHPV